MVRILLNHELIFRGGFLWVIGFPEHLGQEQTGDAALRIDFKRAAQVRDGRIGTRFQGEIVPAQKKRLYIVWLQLEPTLQTLPGVIESIEEQVDMRERLQNQGCLRTLLK